MPLYYYLSAILFFLGIANPLHIPPWNSFHTEMICASAILLLAVIHSIKEKIKIKKSFIIFSSLILIYFLILNFLLEENDYGNLFLYISIYVISLIIGLNSKKINNAHFFIFFIIIGIYLSTSVFYQFFGLKSLFNIFPETTIKNRPGGSLLQPNHTATLICISIACCLCSSFIKKHIQFFILLILFIALAMTQSRTGFIALLVFSIYANFKKYVELKLIILSFIIYSIFYALTPFIYDAYYINSSTSSIRANIQGGRLVTWPILIDAIKLNPITGYGFNNVFYALDLQIRNNENLTSEAFHYSHNIIFDFFIWFGIPASLILIVIFLIKIKKISLEYNKKLEVILIPLITHSLLEYPHAYIYFGVIFFFIFGKCLSDIEGHTLVIQKSFFLFSSLVFSLCTYYAWLYINSEEIVREIRFKSINISLNNDDVTKKHILSYFEMDRKISEINFTENIKESEIKTLKYAAQHRPSKSYQAKYAEALYITNQCDLFHKQMNVISSYYGDNYKNTTMARIKTKYNLFNSCSQ